eukprot:TRINITY_DN3021_c0_g1_i1.p1 TRINITY_DN3021_c0_g1~~TRINITY_DN3021_c0_g1_i1.p1  ORF type:complete len:814 (+),score=225.34 TRINITY_DN3021_c0_g1_i1:226-2442(+)
MAEKAEGLLKQHAGQEEQLLQSLIKKLGPEPADTASPTGAGGGGGGGGGGGSSLPPKPPSDWEPRVQALFRHYDSQREASAGPLLQKHAGREADVWKSLVNKYGPEPYWLERLGRLFKAHKPEMAEKAEGLLKQHAGQEEQLLQSLIKKLGPEPADAAPSGSPSGSAGPIPMTAKAKVLRFYFYLSPEKVEGALKLVGAGGKYAGHEEEMYVSMVKKYEKDPAPADPPGDTDYRARVVNLYALYAGEKLHTVDALLEQYSGRETALIEALVGNYGAEPCRGGGGADAQEGGAGGSRTYLQRVQAILQKYSPAKVGQAADFLKKFEGREEEFIQSLVQKFGPEPAAAPAKEPLTYEQRLTRMLKKNNPEKVATVPSYLKKFSGREEELIEKLVAAYGPEPEDEESDSEQLRQQDRDRAGREWASLAPALRLLHEAERDARWDVEDDRSAALEELVMTERKHRLLAPKLVLADSLAKTHNKSLRKRYHSKCRMVVARMIQEEERRHRALLDERMSVYEQLQTNDHSMRYYEMLQKRREVQRKKQSTKSGPIMPPTRHRKDFITHNVRMASVSPNRRTPSPSRTPSPERRAPPEVVSPAVRDKVLNYQKKWLPASFDPPEYPTRDHEARDVPRSGFSRKSLETRHRERVNRAAQRAQDEMMDGDVWASTLRSMTGTHETGLERAMRERERQTVTRHIAEGQDAWNSLVEEAWRSPNRHSRVPRGGGFSRSRSADYSGQYRD